MAEAAGGERRLPEELVLWEILTRLPSKPLLRCRAVCRSWRRLLTSDAAFLLAHHRRQPALQLVTVGDSRERRIDALDHRAGERRPFARVDLAASPVEGPDADPFEMKGELALYTYNGQTADLWCFLIADDSVLD